MLATPAVSLAHRQAEATGFLTRQLKDSLRKPGHSGNIQSETQGALTSDELVEECYLIITFWVMLLERHVV